MADKILLQLRWQGTQTGRPFTNFRGFVTCAVSDLQEVISALAALLDAKILESDREGVGSRHGDEPYAVRVDWVRVGIVRALECAVAGSEVPTAF